MVKFDQLHITQKSNLRKNVLKIMHKKARPLLIGEVAIELKEHLDTIEECMMQMTDESEKQIELVEKNDNAYQQYDGEVKLFRLVIKPSLVIAHGEDEIRGPNPLSRPRPPK